MEARVRNALASPIWLLYELGGELPSVVTAVALSRTSPARGAYVWSFDGNGGFAAVRLPPGADVVLRELELDAYSGEEPFLLAFATSITSGDRPAEAWAGRAGLSSASGDFTLTDLTTEFEWEADDELAAPSVAIRILCVTRFDADDPVSR